MHDRRIDGEVETFGNQGDLFMNAMTWWDHTTKSIWAQPWGMAISGERKGTRLTLLPVSLVPWATWLSEHPDTTVVEDEYGRAFLPDFIPYDYVIGVSIKEGARGFYMASLLEAGVVNSSVGDRPVVVSVNPGSRDVRVYLRDSGGTPADDDAVVPDLLSFEAAGRDRIRDKETGSEWDTVRGIAVSGPLRGAALQQAPYVTSFDWAWLDFFPASDFWGEAGPGPDGQVIEVHPYTPTP